MFQCGEERIRINIIYFCDNSCEISVPKIIVVFCGNTHQVKIKCFKVKIRERLDNCIVIIVGIFVDKRIDLSADNNFSVFHLVHGLNTEIPNYSRILNSKIAIMVINTLCICFVDIAVADNI